ncbi:hypothetical protein BDB00DRAFT_750785, partial [Zychaea mexicana]|uniref:uncharacterized protein n=1 Tax=Zychaea mexicana TaxID=64656 RepID=UPI0022FE8D9F
RIIGTPALRKGSGLLTINLYDLPHAPVEDLSVAIQRMLAPYGRILDISIFLSSQHSFFMGQGCAYLDVTQAHQPLSTHTLMYPDLEHEVRAFWKGSPPYCRFCHEDTHEKDLCPKRAATLVQACSQCGDYGHSLRSCPRSVQSNPVSAFVGTPPTPQ